MLTLGFDQNQKNKQGQTVKDILENQAKKISKRFGFILSNDKRIIISILVTITLTL